MRTRSWLAASVLLGLCLMEEAALAKKGGGEGGHPSCQTLLGKWRQAGDNHHMRKAMNKQDKIEKKMAKLDCAAPTR
jgi:hypothetical protein